MSRRTTATAELHLVPAYADTEVRLRELVPDTPANVQRWGARMIEGLGNHVDVASVPHLQDALQAATIVMRDESSGAQHHLLALPVAHAEAVSIRDASTGAHACFVWQKDCLHSTHGVPGNASCHVAHAVVSLLC